MKDIGNRAFIADADREWDRICDEADYWEAAAENYLEGIESGDFLEAVREEYVDLHELFLAWKAEDYEKAYRVLDKGLREYSEFQVREHYS